jgi:hypothetical protein
MTSSAGDLVTEQAPPQVQDLLAHPVDVVADRLQGGELDAGVALGQVLEPGVMVGVVVGEDEAVDRLVQGVDEVADLAGELLEDLAVDHDEPVGQLEDGRVHQQRLVRRGVDVDLEALQVDGLNCSVHFRASFRFCGACISRRRFPGVICWYCSAAADYRGESHALGTAARPPVFQIPHRRKFTTGAGVSAP